MKKKKAAGRSLGDFRAAHDPTFEVDSPAVIFERPIPPGTKRVLVVAAQNATPVHPNFWGSLLTMARELAAEIVVPTVRYKNPTSQWTGSQRNEEYWAPEVRPYLCNTRVRLNKNLTILGDIKIQPTASSPLTGADALSHAASGIIGHTKLQMRCIPTPSHRMAKVLTTTGACTIENYTDSRAGRIGEFHHSLSAVLVELDGSTFHLRHVHYSHKLGGVIDLDRLYCPHSVTEAPRPLALVMGDTHVKAIDPGVEKATFGPKGMVATLRPAHLVWHDLLDAYSCNPHHVGNPFSGIAKRRSNADDVRAEVNEAIDYVQRHTPPDTTSVIVGSNHNDMLRRWIMRTDWRGDPTNAEFYLQTALAMARGTKLTPNGTQYPDPFAHWVEQAKLPRTVVLGGDKSFVLGGVELGMHGDMGPNGARGSISNLRRIGIRSIIGHSHSPGINEGCYQVGTSTKLRLEYNHGASSWLNAHAILHADGKRQIVVIVDGKWRLET
jgi:hypothetical protein